MVEMMADGRWLRWLMFDGLERESDRERPKKMRKKCFFYKKSQFFRFDCRQYAKNTI